MADPDPKIAQKVFKDYTRGHAISDISERHGLPTRQVNRIVKFESAVHSRVRAELAKRETKATKTVAKPKAKR